MRVFIMGLCATLALGAVATAQQKYTSNVRLAAIERLQTKLGTIRGSLSREDRHIYLTEDMIEQLKPIRVAKRERLESVSGSSSSGLVGLTAVDHGLMREVNRVAGISGIEDVAGGIDPITTASTTALSNFGGDTSMDDILRLADELSANQ